MSQTLCRGIWPKQRRHPRRRRQGCDVAAECLESRVLLATWSGWHELELVGRDSDGYWQSSGFDRQYSPVIGETVTQENEPYAWWRPDVDWRHVRAGDFDGDGMSDVIGLAGDSGQWWVSLSDMIGSTTRLGVTWSTATQWFEAAVVDLNAPGDRGDVGQFTHKSDLVARDEWGNWWAAISNGDGTFHTQPFFVWNPASQWTQLQFIDFDLDGTTDVVGLDTKGNVAALLSRYNYAPIDLAYMAAAPGTPAGQWSPIVEDFLVLNNFFGDGRMTVAVHTADGVWHVLANTSLPNQPSLLPAPPLVELFDWNPAGGWRDVMTTDLDGDGRSEVIGRTFSGQWWSSSSVPGNGISTKVIGAWNESAGWHDVRATTTRDGADVLVGRTTVGNWWMSEWTSTDMLRSVRLGQWSDAATRRDVHAAHATRSPVAVRYDGTTRLIDIKSHRSGSVASITGYVRVVEGKFGPGGPAPIGFSAGAEVAYDAPGVLGFTSVTRVEGLFWFLGDPWPPVGSDTTTYFVQFDGHLGSDSFTSTRGDTLSNPKPGIARGWAGDDTLVAIDNDAYDQLFGGDGLDVLHGDPGDLIVE